MAILLKGRYVIITLVVFSLLTASLRCTDILPHSSDQTLEEKEPNDKPTIASSILNYFFEEIENGLD